MASENTTSIRPVSERLEQRVERRLPGVRCPFARDCSFGLELTLVAPAEDLLRHDIVTRAMLSSLPTCGVRSYPRC